MQKKLKITLLTETQLAFYHHPFLSSSQKVNSLSFYFHTMMFKCAYEFNARLRATRINIKVFKDKITQHNVTKKLKQK